MEKPFGQEQEGNGQSTRQNTQGRETETMKAIKAEIEKRRFRQEMQDCRAWERGREKARAKCARSAKGWDIETASRILKRQFLEWLGNGGEGLPMFGKFRAFFPNIGKMGVGTFGGVRFGAAHARRMTTDGGNPRTPQGLGRDGRNQRDWRTAHLTILGFANVWQNRNRQRKDSCRGRGLLAK